MKSNGLWSIFNGADEDASFCAYGMKSAFSKRGQLTRSCLVVRH
jgi:hypothetical protein